MGDAILVKARNVAVVLAEDSVASVAAFLASAASLDFTLVVTLF